MVVAIVWALEVEATDDVEIDPVGEAAANKHVRSVAGSPTQFRDIVRATGAPVLQTVPLHELSEGLEHKSVRSACHVKVSWTDR